MSKLLIAIQLNYPCSLCQSDGDETIMFWGKRPTVKCVQSKKERLLCYAINFISVLQNWKVYKDSKSIIKYESAKGSRQCYKNNKGNNSMLNFD